MEIYNECINDIPLIIAICKELLLEEILEEKIGTHGNQEGLANGELLVIWLAYILSEGDHRKSHVSEWVNNHKKCLEAFFDKEIKGEEFNDDRLSGILNRLSEDKKWEELEKSLWQGVIEVLELPSKGIETEGEIGRKIRLDSTSSFGYHKVNEEGLMQYGYSKDDPRGLPRLKMMMSVDEKFRTTIATDIVAGNKNDDVLYLPNIQRIREMTTLSSRKKTLYCGDSKMASLKIRADIAENEEYYICPLQINTAKKKQRLQEAIDQAIERGEDLEKIYKKGEVIAYAYEFTAEEKIKKDDGQDFTWQERVQLVKSVNYYESEKQQADRKIEKIKQKLKKVKGKLFTKEQEAKEYTHKQVNELIKKHNLENILGVSLKIQAEEKQYQRKETRNGKQRTGSYKIIKYRAIVDEISVKEEQIKKIHDRIGWRIYVTNIEQDKFSLQDSYNHYRATQYIIENSFHVLKDKPIGLRPIFVWKEKQIKGLLRLLTLALKVSSIISTKLRNSLQEDDDYLEDIYAGQPKKQTSSPTTKTILNLFYRQNIVLARVTIDNKIYWNVSSFSSTCQEILSRLKIPDVYNKIVLSLQSNTHSLT